MAECVQHRCATLSPTMALCAKTAEWYTACSSSRSRSPKSRKHRGTITSCLPKFLAIRPPAQRGRLPASEVKLGKQTVCTHFELFSPLTRNRHSWFESCLFNSFFSSSTAIRLAAAQASRLIPVTCQDTFTCGWSVLIAKPLLTIPARQLPARTGQSRSTDIENPTCPVLKPKRPAAETSSRGERARDDEPLHFASAFVDLAHAHVAIDALDGIIGEVAVAAVDLNRVRADLLGHLAGE